MMGISLQELLVVALVVVMLFGTRKIPELMRSLGQSYRIFNDSIKEVKHEITKVKDDVNDNLPKVDKI